MFFETYVSIAFVPIDTGSPASRGCANNLLFAIVALSVIVRMNSRSQLTECCKSGEEPS